MGLNNQNVAALEDGPSQGVLANQREQQSLLSGRDRPPIPRSQNQKITPPFRKFETEVTPSFSATHPQNVKPNTGLPRKAYDQLDDSAHHVKKELSWHNPNTVTINSSPLVDIHQQNRRKSPSVKDGDDGVRMKRETSTEREQQLPIQRHIINQSISPLRLDTTEDVKPEVKNNINPPLSAKSQRKSTPRKGAKGALGWLLKSFAKDQHNMSLALSTPDSRLSKRSQRSLDSEHSATETDKDTPRSATRRRLYTETSEAQQRRWLLQVHRAIRDGAVREVIVRNSLQEQQQPVSSLRPSLTKQKKALAAVAATVGQHTHRGASSSDSEIFEEPTVPEMGDIEDGFNALGENHHHRHHRNHPHFPAHQNQHHHRMRKTRDYDAYTTFDDEQSVSSIELLFNWLTCRNASFEERRRRQNLQDFPPVGMEFDIRSRSSDPYVGKKPTREGGGGGLCR